MTIFKKTLSSLIVLLVIGALSLAVRGIPGSPTSEEFGMARWSSNGPLELSPERGRLALMYSIVENHSLVFDVSVARLALPDLAINNMGQYVSLFAPAASYIAIPGYLAGKALGLSQVGAYSIITLFSILNLILIILIARRLGASHFASLLGGLTFVFATPAFSYATTLYQHHVSVFLLLSSVFVLLRFRNVGSLTFVWFACALSVVVDNPNLFLMFPVGIFALMRLFELVRPKKHFLVKKATWSILTFLGLIVPFVFFGWYNFHAYGNALQLPGTLQVVSEIGADGRPVAKNSYELQVLSPEQLAERNQASVAEKSAVGFFKSRNLYNGFYVHFLSPDRGIIFFAPVILLGIIGLALLYRTNIQIVSLIAASIGANVLLYSMWGDPWGGWAFGSRYLIPTYALLAIGITFGLSRWRFRTLFLTLFVPLFAYSAWVNTLGALTSNANPPEIQILSLESQTGHEEKYTFMRNWEYLNGTYQEANAKSFIYQAWAKKLVSPKEYFAFVYGLILLMAASGVVGLMFEMYQKDKKN